MITFDWRLEISPVPIYCVFKNSWEDDDNEALPAFLIQPLHALAKDPHPHLQKYKWYNNYWRPLGQKLWLINTEQADYTKISLPMYISISSATWWGGCDRDWFRGEMVWRRLGSLLDLEASSGRQPGCFEQNCKKAKKLAQFWPKKCIFFDNLGTQRSFPGWPELCRLSCTTTGS